VIKQTLLSIDIIILHYCRKLIGRDNFVILL